MTSILATFMLQSSGTATAIIVALVEEGSISVSQGIYMVMGANIGTTVTSTIVSLAHINDFSAMERGFATATVHDMFNFMTAAVLFPLECATGYLNHLTSALVEGAETGAGGDTWEGPIKRLVSPLSHRIIIVNKKAIVSISKSSSTCDSYYPIECDPGLEPSYNSCNTGLIACNKNTNE
jgi:sodium-dependent phosphate cotransporter